MGGSEADSGKEKRSYDSFPSRSERDLALTALLKREDVLTTDVILRLGYSRTELRGLVGHGDLARVHRGVYVDGRTRLTPWIRLRAALLAAGPTAFLSHRTAAAARKYRGSINTREIHVTVVAEHTPKIPGLVIHRVSEEPFRGEVTTVGGLRASTLPRILIELARSADRVELDELITAGERRNALSEMDGTLERHARRPLLTRLQEALDGHLSTPGGNSGLEADVWEWFYTDTDLPAPDETNVRLGPFEFDGKWNKQRLILEIDSRAYHQAKADFEKDRIKDAYAQKHGFRIIRVTEDRFKQDRAGVHADLQAFLRQAAA